MLIKDITDTIEEAAPLALQESYDNAGLIIGDSREECSGVLFCVDVTPDTVEEASRRGCNLIVSHHPLIFKGLKRLTGSTLQQRAAIAAIKAGIAVYAAHTNLDAAENGVNYTLADMLGLSDITPLATAPGVVGSLCPPLTATELVERIKKVCGSPVTRCTVPPQGKLSRLALCGGSGSFLIDDAADAGADAFLTSDVKYHDFVDNADRIFIIDIGHYESEKCTKQIFYHIVSKKFPNFALYYSETEKNPINYL